MNEVMENDPQKLRAIVEAKSREITDLKVQLKLARRDELTGLPRRTELIEETQRSLSSKQLPTSMIFLDVNKFKEINDTVGHAAGDSLIIQFGEFLKKQKESLSENGLSVVARLSGDEFAILLPYTNCEEASNFVHLMKENLKKEFFIIGDELRFSIRAAMGVATTKPDCLTVANLLHRADQSMYADKVCMEKAGEVTKKL